MKGGVIMYRRRSFRRGLRKRYAPSRRRLHYYSGRGGVRL